MRLRSMEGKRRGIRNKDIRGLVTDSPRTAAAGYWSASRSRWLETLRDLPATAPHPAGRYPRSCRAAACRRPFSP